MMEAPQAVTLIVLFVTVGVTVTNVARAFVRRLEARDRVRAGALGELSDERLARIEHAVEAIALEVERVSEGQRFTTNLLSERAALPAKARGDMSRRSE